MKKVSYGELENRLAELFISADLTEEDSRNLTEIILDAECSGRTTHGLVRVRPMLRYIDEFGHRDGRWIIERPGHALLDAQKGLGYLSARKCALKAIELASEGGMAVVGAQDCSHTGPIGYFCRLCAERGFIGIGFANCTPLAAPHGGKKAVLGTNPVAMAFPADPEPVVADLATTAFNYGQCMVARQNGEPIPEGVLIDSQGNPTTDPNDAMRGGALLPMGAHKGYALSVAVQLITSAFIGALAIPPARHGYGLTIIALKKDMFVSAEIFDNILAELALNIRQCEPTDPTVPVVLPGEHSAANRSENLKNGIEISDSLCGEIFG